MDEWRRRVAGNARRTTRSLDAAAEGGLLVAAAAEARRCRTKSRGVGDVVAALLTVRRAVLELTDMVG